MEMVLPPGHKQSNVVWLVGFLLLLTVGFGAWKTMDSWMQRRDDGGTRTATAMQRDIEFFLEHDDLDETGEAVDRLLADGVPALELMKREIESTGASASGLSYVIGLSTEPESTTILKELLDDDDELVRLGAAVELAYGKHDHSGIDVLYEAYPTADEGWRALIEDALFCINERPPVSTEASMSAP
ncbi:MAG: hypothetical protein AB2L09_08955 [Coriobacteriia bacterium]